MLSKSVQPPVTRSLESGVTFWTPAQIDIVLVQVGGDANGRFNEYWPLVCQFRQLQLRTFCPRLLAVCSPSARRLLAVADRYAHTRAALDHTAGNVQPFYRAETKSPFKFYPWRSGTLNFRFAVGGAEEIARRKSPLACLHASRNTRAVIGILCTQDADALSVRFDEAVAWI